MGIDNRMIDSLADSLLRRIFKRAGIAGETRVNGDGSEGELEAGLLLPVRCRSGSDEGPGRGRDRDPDPLQLRCERPPSGGRAGVRQGLRALIQKTYNPPPHPPAHAAHQSAQGPWRGPPGSSPVSWDEALGAIAGQDARDPLPGASGRVGGSRGSTVSFGGGGTPTPVHGGPFPAFPLRVGSHRHGLRGRAGGQVLPQRAPLRRALATERSSSPPTPPAPATSSVAATTRRPSAGVAGVWRQADARARAGSSASRSSRTSPSPGRCRPEWVPIRPKTDAAFPLRAPPPHRGTEREWREVCDVAFLEESTNAPYLVGARTATSSATRRAAGPCSSTSTRSGRSRSTRSRGAARPSNGVRVAAGVEEGPDGEEWHHEAAEARPAFQVFLDHVRGVHPGMGGGRERRAGRDHPPHRGRVPRPRLGRRDHRDRGAGDALPPRRGPPRQGG